MNVSAAFTQSIVRKSNDNREFHGASVGDDAAMNCRGAGMFGWPMRWFPVVVRGEREGKKVKFVLC